MQKMTNEKKTLLGRRIRALRNIKGWTQEELGKRADVNYKFIGEIERGRQNPSLNVLYKIASAMQVDLPELFRAEHEILDRKEIEAKILRILKKVTEEELRQVLLLLHTLHPIV